MKLIFHVHIVDFVPSLVNPLDSRKGRGRFYARSISFWVALILFPGDRNRNVTSLAGEASRFDVYPLRDKTYKMGETFRWRGKKRVCCCRNRTNVFPTCFYLIKSSVDTSRSVVTPRYDREITHSVRVCTLEDGHGDSVSRWDLWEEGGDFL